MTQQFNPFMPGLDEKYKNMDWDEELKLEVKTKRLEDILKPLMNYGLGFLPYNIGALASWALDCFMKVERRVQQEKEDLLVKFTESMQHLEEIYKHGGCNPNGDYDKNIYYHMYKDSGIIDIVKEYLSYNYLCHVTPDEEATKELWHIILRSLEQRGEDGLRIILKDVEFIKNKQLILFTR